MPKLTQALSQPRQVWTILRSQERKRTNSCQGIPSNSSPIKSQILSSMKFFCLRSLSSWEERSYKNTTLKLATQNCLTSARSWGRRVFHLRRSLEIKIRNLYKNGRKIWRLISMSRHQIDPLTSWSLWSRSRKHLKNQILKHNLSYRESQWSFKSIKILIKRVLQREPI